MMDSQCCKGSQLVESLADKKTNSSCQDGSIFEASTWFGHLMNIQTSSQDITHLLFTIKLLRDTYHNPLMCSTAFSDDYNATIALRDTMTIT